MIKHWFHMMRFIHLCHYCQMVEFVCHILFHQCLFLECCLGFASLSADNSLFLSVTWKIKKSASKDSKYIFYHFHNKYKLDTERMVDWFYDKWISCLNLNYVALEICWKFYFIIPHINVYICSKPSHALSNKTFDNKMFANLLPNECAINYYDLLNRV